MTDNFRLRIHTALVLLVFAMMSIFRVASAHAAIDEKTWSFRFEDTPLIDALEEIHDAFGTDFLFPGSKSAPESVRKIYIEYTLEEILRDIFSNRNRALIWHYDNGTPKSVEVWLFDENGGDNWILPDSIPAGKTTDIGLPERPRRVALPTPSAEPAGAAGPSEAGEPPPVSTGKPSARVGMWTFTFEDISLEDALKEIYRVSGLEVIFPNKEIDGRVIWKEYLDQPLEWIVKDIFENDNCAMVWQYEGKRPRIVNVWAFEEKPRSSREANGDRSADEAERRPDGNPSNVRPSEG